MTGWKQEMGMSEEMRLVKSYVPEHVKETWKEEAEEQGYSLSKYVAAKVEEARAREQVDSSTTNQEVEQLQQRIAELEDQLEEARTKQTPSATATVSILDDGTVKQALSYQCKSLEVVLQELIEGAAVDQLIREPVETRLYELAAEQEVEFQRGAGWRLKTGGEN